MKKQLAALLLALILLFGLMPSPVMAAGAAGEPEAPEGNELSLSIRINCVNHPEHSGTITLNEGNYDYDGKVYFDAESGRYYGGVGAQRIYGHVQHPRRHGGRPADRCLQEHRGKAR